MTVGRWYEKVYQTPARIAGSLYTTDFDDRAELAEDYTLTTVDGKDLGYPSRPSLNFGALFWRSAIISRNRYFGRVTNIKRVWEQILAMYCYVPFFARNATVYGFKKTVGQMREREFAARHSVQDPNRYKAWTYDWILHWAAFDEDTTWMDSPMPDMWCPPNPLWVEEHVYSEGPCSDWADGGQYIKELPADYTWLLYADMGGVQASLKNPEIPPAYHEYSIPEADKEPDKEFQNHASIIDVPTKISSLEVSSFHFSGSPDMAGNVFYQDSSRVEAGDATYASLSDTGGAGPGERARFGFTRVADHRRAQHFIGVING